MTKSELEAELLFQVQAVGLPEPEREHRFGAVAVGPGKGLRKRLEAAGLKDWRFDLAWPPAMVAVEVQGGTWTKGAHVRGARYRDDCEKLNAGQLLGWTVLWCTSGMVRDGSALAAVERALAAREPPFLQKI